MFKITVLTCYPDSSQLSQVLRYLLISMKKKHLTGTLVGKEVVWSVHKYHHVHVSDKLFVLSL